MAEDIGERCGQHTVEPAMATLSVMTDALFGPDSDPRGRRMQMPSHVQRPSPRTLDAITQKVISKTGSVEKSDAVKALVFQLTDSVFGAGQDYPTARSSVRSMESSTSSVMKREVNREVRYVLTEMCNVLFQAS